MTANCLRVLEQDLEVGGHLVPGGTVAVLCHMTMAHNPEVLSVLILYGKLDENSKTPQSTMKKFLKC